MDAVVCCLFACCVWVNKVQVYHVHARTSRPKCFQNTSQCILINNINTLLYVFSDSFRIHNRHIVIMIFLSYFRSIYNTIIQYRLFIGNVLCGTARKRLNVETDVICSPFNAKEKFELYNLSISSLHVELLIGVHLILC